MTVNDLIKVLPPATPLYVHKYSNYEDKVIINSDHALMKEILHNWTITRLWYMGNIIHIIISYEEKR